MYTHLCVLREEGGSRGARKYVVPYQSKSSMPGVQFSPRIYVSSIFLVILNADRANIR